MKKTKWRWGEEYRRRQFHFDIKAIGKLKDEKIFMRNFDEENFSWELWLRGRWLPMQVDKNALKPEAQRTDF